MSNVDDIFDRASHLFNVLTFARYKLELMPDEDIATAEIACAAIERWVSDFEYDPSDPVARRLSASSALSFRQTPSAQSDQSSGSGARLGKRTSDAAGLDDDAETQDYAYSEDYDHMEDHSHSVNSRDWEDHVYALSRASRCVFFTPSFTEGRYFERALDCAFNLGIGLLDVANQRCPWFESHMYGLQSAFVQWVAWTLECQRQEVLFPSPAVGSTMLSHQPMRVRQWRDAGVHTKLPHMKFGDRIEFAIEWREWYKAVLPDWVHYDARGWPRLHRNADAHYTTFMVPGINGIIILMLTLFWWLPEDQLSAGYQCWVHYKDHLLWMLPEAIAWFRNLSTTPLSTNTTLKEASSSMRGAKKFRLM